MDDYSRNNISSAMIFFLVVVVSCFVASVRSNQQITCIDNGNYTQNSTYDNNLSNVLSSLTLNMINVTGFYYASSGQAPNKANALVMCRADVSFDYCKNCTERAISDIRSCCPNQKQAVNWQEHCMLKYSDDILYARLQMGNRRYCHNNANTTSPARFKQDLKILLENLRGKAASGGVSLKMAAGDVPGPDFQKIFAMVQCTPDLSHEDCKSCLTNAIGDMYPNCDGSIGCVVFFESCYLRYETYMFYNATRIRELETPASFVHTDGRAPASSPPPPPPPGFAGSDFGGDNKARTIIIIIVIVSVAMVVLVILIITGYIIFKERTKGQQWLNADENSTVESLRYDYFKIRDATNDFSDENKLGKGGFGVVYKGKLSTGQEIAVKRLSKNSGQGDLEFMNEVLLLARLQHRNLVKLLGFALEGSDKLLVYEFVQNASLDKFIFDPLKRSELDWDRRRKIIGGIARGILYLHEDSRLRIIHRDLKASNVLLDCEMNPKIADFGIARLFDQDDQTHGNTLRIVGTYGYMAPEYAIHGQFSVKSDVFSFGVLLLEIVSGRKNASFENEDEDLLSFAWRNWRDWTCTNVIDPILKSSSSDSIKEMVRCIHIGLLCVQDKVADRPKMASVVLMLSSLSMTLALPSEPTFFIQGSVAYESYAKKFDISNASFSATATHEKNEASITRVYPQ